MKRIGLVFLGLATIACFRQMATAAPLEIAELQSRHPSKHFEEIELPSGKTHFQAIGNGPAVILIHGVSGPLAVWDKTVDPLVKAGYQVVRYDLFGRGFSKRLTGEDYTLDLFHRQLGELIGALNLGPGVLLVGSSFGAVIATEYAIRQPNQVRGLVLVGPAGFPIGVPWTAKLRNIPILGDVLSYFLAYKTILKQNDHYFVDGRMPSELRAFIADQLSVPGTTQAILSTMDNSPVQSYVPSYRKLGNTNIPVGVIWGRLDLTFPHENSAVLLNAAPQAKLSTIENAGHLPQYERSEQVSNAIIGFLNDWFFGL